jgi:hypothetical protein
MSTTLQPDHEHPQYVTKADLEAFEGRMLNRMAELELRLERSISTAFWRQLLTLLGVILALAVPIINVGINILATQATILSKLP